MSQQDENIARFMNSQAKAKALIQMDARGELDKMKNKAVNEGKINFDTNGNVTPMEYRKTEMPTNQIQQSVVKNSSLPKEILESMTNEKIGTFCSSSNGSVLDQLNMLSNGTLLKEDNDKTNNNSVKEVLTNNNNQQVDYSLIKSIVESCMKKYVSSLKKTIISESKVNENNSDTIQAMKLGNKFSFITKNGDLYEANLKFIKHIK